MRSRVRAEVGARPRLSKRILIPNSVGCPLLILKTSNQDLERRSKEWSALIYAFFEPVSEIEYVEGRRCHTFKCAGKSCKKKICQYLDTKGLQFHEQPEEACEILLG